MSANKLKVQAFRANDLSEDTGKQFELGKSWCDFFEIADTVGDISFKLEFKPINNTYESLNGRQIDLQLSGLTNRNDRKAYANGTRSGHSAIKEFFLEDLHLSMENNSGDYFAIYKANAYDYYLYYIPKLLHDNFIRFFETISPTITISRSSDKKSISGVCPQQIFYGAPGTGKSNEIKEKTTGQDVIRTTFHPDSDYSTFVGAYKPVMEEVEQHVVPVVVENGISLNQNNGTYKEKRITYKFVMQAFLKAYLGAWKKYADKPEDPKPQYLVIEEINRGNCAQIFGDLFQLLDRNEKDFSTYPIDADTDLRLVVKDAFENDEDYQLTTDLAVDNVIDGYTSNYGATLSKDIQEGRVLVLPKNLYIWATMNTSDQSLFPIDSAFKRRWDWKYIKICDHKEENYKILIDDKDGGTDWWEFLKKINEIIASMTSSADKQLGYFFCKADNNKIISKEKFVSKVIFYLWNDVFKDYGFEDASLFRYKDSDGVERDLTFPDFYNEDGKEVNTTRLKDFLEKVKNWKSKTEDNK